MSDKYMDWHDFDIKPGSKVSYAVGDQIVTGTVKSVDEDEEKNIVTITFEQFDVGPPWNRSTPEQKDS